MHILQVDFKEDQLVVAQLLMMLLQAVLQVSLFAAPLLVLQLNLLVSITVHAIIVNVYHHPYIILLALYLPIIKHLILYH
jgi:hypothetical protein